MADITQDIRGWLDGKACHSSASLLQRAHDEIERLRKQTQEDALQLLATDGQADEHWQEAQRLRGERDDLLSILIAFRDAGPDGGQDFAGWHAAYAVPVAQARAYLERHSNTQSTGVDL